MAPCLLLLLLPALAAGKINIEISGDMTGDERDMKVHFSGQEYDVIADAEQNTFKLNDYNLKNGVNNYFGKRPDDAYVRSPTPWGDLFMSYGWEQTMRTLRPRSAKILKIAQEPQIVKSQIFENNSTKASTFNVAISQSVQNTVSTSWSKSETLTLGQDISYEFEIGMKLGGKTTFNFASSYGYDDAKSESVIVGSSSGVSVLLQPGQAVVSELQATKGTLYVEIEYEANLSGNLAVNYNEAHKGHHFWKLPVTEVMKAAGLENRLVNKEVIKIGFFSESKIVVYDRKLNYRMLDVNL